MRQVLLLLLGAILIGILSYFCFIDKAGVIKDDLVSKANSAYAGKQMGWVDANLKGEDLELTRILTLNGTAPSIELKQEAEKVALNIEGVDGVDNRLVVAKVIAPVVVVEPVKPKVVIPSPYILAAAKDKDNKVIISGYTPNALIHEEIIDQAKAIFGSTNVTDELKEAEGAPQEFVLSTKFGLEKLKNVDYGEFKIADYDFNFKGYVGSEDDKTALLKSLENKLSSKYEGSFDIKAPEKAPTPKEIVISCQDQFKKILSQDKIHFENDKADIKQKSHTLLDNLVTVAKKCSNTNISIEGHTDSKGSEKYNQALSEKRANAVKEYFIKKGISKVRLQAVGIGETKPIADNKTEDGKAKNRRIEFIIKGVE